MRAALSFVVSIALILVPVSPVLAGGCEKDTDCKGDRICVQGECTDPTPAARPAASPSARLIRVTDQHYRYGGEDIAWDEARAILATYSRSDETLRKGEGYKAFGGTMVGVGAGMMALGFVLIGLGQVDHVYDEDGNIRRERPCESDEGCVIGGSVAAGSGLLIGLGFGLPFSVLGGTAKHRAVERYNRAVEEGKVHSP